MMASAVSPLPRHRSETRRSEVRYTSNTLNIDRETATLAAAPSASRLAAGGPPGATATQEKRAVSQHAPRSGTEEYIASSRGRAEGFESAAAKTRRAMSSTRTGKGAGGVGAGPSASASSTTGGVEQLPLSHELLAYYRQRIERSEDDYLKALALTDEIKPSQEAYHQSQWQIGQFNVQIAELQKALSDAQTALANERKIIVQLIAENDALKIQEFKDRRKVNYLLTAEKQSSKRHGKNVPIDGAETTYFKDKLNKKIIFQPKSSRIHKLRPHQSASPVGRAGREMAVDDFLDTTRWSHLAGTRVNMDEAKKAKMGQRTHGDEGYNDEDGADEDETPEQRAFRLKAEQVADKDVEALKMTIKALRSQLDDQNRVFEECLDAYQSDREILLHDDATRRERTQTREEELLKRIERLEELNRQNTKELIEQKRNLLIYERHMKEDRLKLVADLNMTHTTLQSEKARNQTIELEVENRMKGRHEQVINELRREVHRYQDDLRTLRIKQDQTTIDYEKRIEALKGKINSQGSSYKALQTRRDYEIEGFTTDIQMLRKQIRVLEKQILQSKPLQDQELNLLGMAKETGEKAEQIASHLHTLKGRSSGSAHRYRVNFTERNPHYGNCRFNHVCF